MYRGGVSVSNGIPPLLWGEAVFFSTVLTKFNRQIIVKVNNVYHSNRLFRL